VDAASIHRQAQSNNTRTSTATCAHAEDSKIAKHAALQQEQRIQAEQQRRYQQQIFASQDRKYDSADIHMLSSYMEELYEDDRATKIRGVGMISQLFRDARNFEQLLSKAGLLQLLSRTLREEGKKSTDLAINIISVFFSMSNFVQFHGLIMDNQVGAMTMDLIDLEVQRTALRIHETGLSPADIAQKVRGTYEHRVRPAATTRTGSSTGCTAYQPGACCGSARAPKSWSQRTGQR
jgi:Kinesin-associated protein (KAP)